jgi:hypothetical protein
MQLFLSLECKRTLATFETCYNLINKSLKLKTGAAKQSAGTDGSKNIFDYIKKAVEAKP